MPPNFLNILVNVTRRSSTGTDVLGNPTYGAPTSGAGWSTVYTGMPAKLAFSSKSIQFANTAERPTPSGIVYYGSAYALQVEDRVITPDGIEYVVTSIVIAYNPANAVDHFEAIVELP